MTDLQNLAARPSRPASDLFSKYRAFESDFCDPLAMAASNLFPFPIEVEYSPLADESMTLNCRLTEMRRSSDRRSQTLIIGQVNHVHVTTRLCPNHTPV